MKSRWPKLSAEEKSHWLRQAGEDEDERPAAAASHKREDPAALVENKQENQDHDARKKAFTDLGSKRQKTRVSELCDQLSAEHSMDDAAQLVSMSLKKLEEQWPGICSRVADTVAQKEPQTSAECERCTQVLSHIAAIPGFTVPYPPRALYEFRAEVDKVVRATTGDMATANHLGYQIGQNRWAAAAADTIADRSTRGRPSQVNDEENVSKVREILQKYSQPSSDPCLNKDREWVPSVTMTKRKSTIFAESKLQETMSAKACC